MARQPSRRDQLRALHPSTRSTPAATLDQPASEAGEAAPRRLTGRAVPYNRPTDLGNVVETFSAGAFRDSLAAVANLPLLTYHDSKVDPVGVAVSWQERADGLHGTWELDDSPRAREVARLVERGVLNFLSIRFGGPREEQWSTGPDGREHVRVLRARLIEVSLVSTPAYAEATVTGLRTAPAALADLARRYDAPLLTAAVTGTADQVRLATSLVRVHVEQHGTGAAGRLEELAASPATDPTLAVNLARAASALGDASRGRLTGVMLDEMRARFGLGQVIRGPRLPGAPGQPRRRPHRR